MTCAAAPVDPVVENPRPWTGLREVPCSGRARPSSRSWRSSPASSATSPPTGCCPSPLVLAGLLALAVPFCASAADPAGVPLRRIVLLLVAGQTAVHVALSVTAGHRGDGHSARGAPAPATSCCRPRTGSGSARCSTATRRRWPGGGHDRARAAGRLAVRRAVRARPDDGRPPRSPPRWSASGSAVGERSLWALVALAGARRCPDRCSLAGAWLRPAVVPGPSRAVAAAPRPLAATRSFSPAASCAAVHRLSSPDRPSAPGADHVDRPASPRACRHAHVLEERHDHLRAPAARTHPTGHRDRGPGCSAPSGAGTSTPASWWSRSCCCWPTTGLIYLFRFQLEPLLHPDLMKVDAAGRPDRRSRTPPSSRPWSATFPDATVVSMAEPRDAGPEHDLLDRRRRTARPRTSTSTRTAPRCSAR